MPRLILSLDGQVMAEYNIRKERYTIGRLADNDIRIDNPAVSGHHSLLINILNDSFLEDLNSTNGTYVNGKLIKKHALQAGDVITIGHHQLRYVEGAADSPDDEFERTMVITPGSAVADRAAAKASSAVAKSADADAPKQPVALPRAKLQVLSGRFAGQEVELDSTFKSVGRPGVQVACFTRRAEGFYIFHVDSGSGESGRAQDYPLVNGSPIGEQAHRLQDNDVILLAGVKIGFFEY